ncbi:MAG: GTPase HflX [Terriglobia bacterium]
MQVLENAFLAGWESTRRDAVTVGIADAEDSLRELKELTASAGARVVGTALQRSSDPDPATLLGRGKVHEIRAEAHAAGADLVIFDHDLTPTQLRNLERMLDLKVIDRTQIILDIFARRARSREGQLQVELAQLNYLLPRLSGHGTALSRLGGGIGTRGPGEQKLEMDRRRIRGRIRILTEGIERVRSQRALHRAHRRDQNLHTVALVGYTNAGKSTLFNALTSAGVVTSARMFATLDPTVRALPLDSHRMALLSDTVGFIRKLPSHLVAAFRATLEELEEARLLLHVTDASDPQRDAQDAAVEVLLEDLGVAATPRLHVWNKVDLLAPGERRKLETEERSVATSAQTGEGLENLRQRIADALAADPMVEAEFDLSSSDGKHLALLHQSGTVVSTHYEADRVFVRARVPESVREKLKLSTIEASRER